MQACRINFGEVGELSRVKKYLSRWHLDSIESNQAFEGRPDTNLDEYEPPLSELAASKSFLFGAEAYQWLAARLSSKLPLERAYLANQERHTFLSLSFNPDCLFHCGLKHSVFPNGTGTPC